MFSCKCSKVGDIEQLLRAKTLLGCISEVPDSILCRETGYLD